MLVKLTQGDVRIFRTNVVSAAFTMYMQLEKVAEMTVV